MVKGAGSVIDFDSPLNLKTVEEVATWAYSQFLNVERVLNEGAIYLRVVPIATAPLKPRNGMIVYATGAPGWNPDGLGAGLFGFVSGTWQRLDV